MAGSMGTLITLLSENEKVLEEFASVLNEEQRCIVDLDLEMLTENSSRKERITTRLTGFRDECSLLLRQTGQELGLSGTPTLSTLVAAAGSREQTELRPLQSRLTTLAKRLERQHEINRVMLEKSTGMINSSLSLFTRLLGGCDTYGAQGRITRGGTAWSLLRQEI